MIVCGSTYDVELARDTQITIAVQVNGKVRAQIVVAADVTQAQVEPQAPELLRKMVGR